ncbi:tryptophanyl-tRNA synthetase [compost metagenome]
MSATGQLLLQSTAFDAPKEAGQSIARLQQQGTAALAELEARLVPVEGVDAAQVSEALDQLIAANA